MSLSEDYSRILDEYRFLVGDLIHLVDLSLDSHERVSNKDLTDCIQKSLDRMNMMKNKISFKRSEKDESQ